MRTPIDLPSGTPRLLLANLTAKLGWKLSESYGPEAFARIEIVTADLVVLASAPYTTKYRGEIYRGVAGGLTVIAGEFRRGGRTITVFPKFVSHPFYQYGCRA